MTAVLIIMLGIGVVLLMGTTWALQGVVKDNRLLRIELAQAQESETAMRKALVEATDDMTQMIEMLLSAKDAGSDA
jgi:hypothetical protein